MVPSLVETGPPQHGIRLRQLPNVRNQARNATTIKRASAQSAFGTAVGQVTDPSGTLVPGAMKHDCISKRPISSKRKCRRYLRSTFRSARLRIGHMIYANESLRTTLRQSCHLLFRSFLTRSVIFVESLSALASSPFWLYALIRMAAAPRFSESSSIALSRCCSASPCSPRAK
jgi:hypothetical protein